MPKNVYLAGSLFSVWERHANTLVADGLRQAGYEVLLPQDIQAPPSSDGGLDMRFVFNECVRLLDKADAVVALAEGPDPDSGTAWEMGYAAAKEIPTLCVRTDMRAAEQGVPTNIMLALGSTDMLHLPSYTGTLDQTIGSIVTKLGEIVDGNPV